MAADQFMKNYLIELDEAMKKLRQGKGTVISVKLALRSIETQLHALLCLAPKNFDAASQAVLDICEPLMREDVIRQNPNLVDEMIGVLKTARTKLAAFLERIEKEA